MEKTQAKFTPGPWKAHEIELKLPVFASEKDMRDEKPYRVSKQKMLMVHAGDHDGGLGVAYVLLFENGQANTHLIAAAPDMYEALKPFAGLFKPNLDDLYSDDMVVFSTGGTVITVGDVRKIRAALAKANGETK